MGVTIKGISGIDVDVILGNCTKPFVMIVSHIQRIGCQPEKTTLHGGQSRSWSAEQGNGHHIKQAGQGSIG